MLGTILLMAAIIVSLLASVISPHDPNRQEIDWRLSEPGSTMPGLRPFYLGTDQLGRDILSRVIFGTRISVAVGFTSVVSSAVIGITLGLYSGYYGGLLDSLIMRAVDLQMAFPFILLALAILSLWGPSVTNIIATFVVTAWPIYARTIRASVLALRQTPLVDAGRSVGLTDTKLLFRHVLPNCLNAVTVIASFELGRIILAESALSFLGLGVQPPTPSWGTMLADGRDYIRTAWWLIAFPGFAIMGVVLAANLLGDSARDYFDPKTRLRL